MVLDIRRSWMRLRSLQNHLSDSLFALPAAIVCVTGRCNSRCISCDFWRHGRNDMSLEHARHLSRELSRLGTRYVLLSGGEPLQHPQWEAIAAEFRLQGARVALATSGLLLARHAAAVAGCIDELYLSLDGATPETYRVVRGVDGFGLVQQGMERMAARLPVTVRTTVQRCNYREIPALIRLSRSWGAAHHSFLSVDVSSQFAFARDADFDCSMALAEVDLDPFRQVIEATVNEFGPEIERGYLLESAKKLRGLHGYFAAVLGRQAFPRIRCNAPRFSAVIEADGSLKPCFFLPAAGRFEDGSISRELNSPAGRELRRQQRQGLRAECRRCVCPAYKSGRELLVGV